VTHNPAILVVNCGSSSVKFALFADEGAAPRRLASGAVERLAGLALACLAHHRSPKAVPVRAAVPEPSLACAPQPEHACCPTQE
jgi:acetate kinase